MPQVIHKLRYTPMRDLFRGRISGRLDYKGRIESADLPHEAKELIARTVRRSRLWRMEKVSVADELIAHFSDGLAAGTACEQLLDSFGDERAAAKLIRRAKIRNRPIVWHFLRAIMRGIATIILLYAGMTIYFLSGKPTVSVNYLDRLNADVIATPMDQRGWPIYRRAILAMDDRTMRQQEELDDLFQQQPDDKNWVMTQVWLDEHTAVVDQIRQAANKLKLGFILGPNGSAKDPELWPGSQNLVVHADLIGTTLPHVLEIFRLAAVLHADAEVALWRGNAAEFLLDCHALLNMAQQIRENHFLLNDRYAIFIRDLTLDVLDTALSDHPQILKEADLRDLAHSVAQPDTASQMIDVEAESIGFYDRLQRVYTDDGNGDGRLTEQGVAFPTLGHPRRNSDDYFGRGYDPRLVDLTIKLAYPSILPIAAGRQEMLEKYESFIDIVQASLNVPAYQVDMMTPYHQVVELYKSPLARYRYPLMDLMPGYASTRRDCEMYLGHRDGVLTAIALEFYRRQHGQYPKSLDELVPSVLPVMPIDRIIGGPVHYRLIDGKPVVYSVGGDRDDDGGKAPLCQGKRSILWSAVWDTNYQHVLDGDWILFPQSHNNQADR